ncbi:MAG: response regulator [Deltaproteobacteria bacterium]|nr:response regulator [Deltaproteobacteria bacterium]
MGKNVLLVANDRAIRSMTSHKLRAEDYTVFDADGTADALDKLFSSEYAKPDIIITALDVIETNVNSFIKCVRGNPEFRFIPILVLAAEDMLHKQMEWKEAGATCWLTKPFTGDQLAQLVNMVLF